MTIYLTVAEVAAALRISKQTVYRLFAQQKLRGVKIGSQVRIHPESLRDYLASVGNAAVASADDADPDSQQSPPPTPLRIKGFRHVHPSPP